MTFLPIVERELRVRARLKSTYRVRMIAAVGSIVLAALLLLVSDATRGTGGFGRFVFQTLAGLSFLYALLDGARNTADCLSEEKRSGTLGLLFLTDLRPYDVVLGKLMAASLNSLYGLIAIFPPLAIPLVLGGVTVGEFWRLVLVLLNTLFFSLSVGLVVSAFCRDERVAWTWTLAIILVFAIVPPLLLQRAAWSSSIPAAMSPTSAVLSLSDAVYSTTPARFWRAFQCVHWLSWGCLAAATLVLPCTWQDRRDDEARSRWWQRLLPSGASVSNRRDSGRLQALLELDPLAWLVARDRGSRGFLWTLAALPIVIAGAAWIFTPGTRIDLVAIALMMLLVHWTLAIWLASEACHLMSKARDSGALELLVCTPLKVKEIVEGHLRGLKAMVYRPVVALVSVEGILIGVQLYRMGQAGVSLDLCFFALFLCALYLTGLVLDLVAVARYGLWQGLSNRKPARAVTKTVLWVLLVPLACSLGVLFPLTNIIKNLILTNYSQSQLRRYFRSLLTERYGWAEEGEFVGQASQRARGTQLPSVLR